MNNRNVKIWMSCTVLLIEVTIKASAMWDKIRCSSDPEQSLKDGTVADIGRFPWLGVVQHSFYIGGATHFAVTSAVLIHPSYAIAPAEDIAKIRREQLVNNTKLLLWESKTQKYALDVNDYLLHPEYELKKTFATIALLELFTDAQANIAPVLPVCLPFTGGGSFTDLYTVKMTDDNMELQKEVYKMSYVADKECAEFYYNNKLTYSKMTPESSICMRVERATAPCVWDAGAALIMRQSWGFWKLIGFSVRGPGCGAPARFLVVHDYLPWLAELLAPRASDPAGAGAGGELHRVAFRRLSPVDVIMYPTGHIHQKEQGQCHRKKRGGIIYKDVFEVTINQDFGQGFFYVVVSQVARFNCLIVHMQDGLARSNAGIWIEHYCHREITGIALGQGKPRDYAKMECFLYFKSAAFIKFKFSFSFKAQVEVALYGTTELKTRLPNPWRAEVTDPWHPTGRALGRIKENTFQLYNLPYWNV